MNREWYKIISYVHKACTLSMYIKLVLKVNFKHANSIYLCFMLLERASLNIEESEMEEVFSYILTFVNAIISKSPFYTKKIIKELCFRIENNIII